jgi:hypothetical protein
MILRVQRYAFLAEKQRLYWVFNNKLPTEPGTANHGCDKQYRPGHKKRLRLRNP